MSTSKSISISISRSYLNDISHIPSSDESVSSKSPGRKHWRWAKKRGVELGAGLGLPAIVAARLGSEVVATAAWQGGWKGWWESHSKTRVKHG